MAEITIGGRIWLLACVLLLGCTKELGWSLPSEPVQLQHYEQGRPVATCTLSTTSPGYKALADWVAEHQTGWSASPATYVPSKIATGRNFSINFMGGLAVVNYTGGQFTHKVSPNEYAFLACSAAT
jgi:hypothetical protein